MQFPVALLEDRDKRAQWQGIPVLLRRLHESSHPNSDLSKIHSIVTVLKTSLSVHTMQRLKPICIICDQWLNELICDAGAVITAVYGGHVICHRGAQDTTGVDFTQYIYVCLVRGS